MWRDGGGMHVVYTIEEDSTSLHTHAVSSLPTALQPGLMQVWQLGLVCLLQGRQLLSLAVLLSAD